jgi:hypothetical protein
MFMVGGGGGEQHTIALVSNANTGMVLDDIGAVLRDLVPVDNIPP